MTICVPSTDPPHVAEPGAPYDETLADPGAHEVVLSMLERSDLGDLCRDVRQAVSDAGVQFESSEGGAEFAVDPVPRILAAGEWDTLATGLAQRVRALECFVADVYSEQEIVGAGVVPATAIVGAGYYEAGLSGLRVGTWIVVAGLDVVRDIDGSFKVLEDNVRTPSGLAYAMAVRDAVTRRVPVPPGRVLRRLADAPGLLREAIASAAPAGIAEPHAVLLTDGPVNSAYYEHQTLSRLLGLPLVLPEQLEVARGRLWLRSEGARTAVDVVYRRTDADRVFGVDGRAEPLGELLLEPWQRGQLGVVNAFGTGVADDKLVHSYVEDMVRFYLGEEPLLASVATHDLSRPGVLEMVLERAGELVIKPRDGHGGIGVMIGPACTEAQLARTRVDVIEDPSAFVAQELVALSRHPTVSSGRLSPRHIDLRPFVLTIGDRVEVVPGGLTRVALEEDSLVVNSSRNGGAKDTWVLD